MDERTKSAQMLVDEVDERLAKLVDLVSGAGPVDIGRVAELERQLAERTKHYEDQVAERDAFAAEVRRLRTVAGSICPLAGYTNALIRAVHEALAVVEGWDSVEGADRLLLDLRRALDGEA